MPDIFAQASIAVLPSTYGEGVPKFLIEAAACGLPIVTYDVPGCREIVRNGKNGFLASPKDIQGLADRIKYLLANPSLCQEMGRCGRTLVENEFSEAAIAAKTLEMYSKVLDAA